MRGIDDSDGSQNKPQTMKGFYRRKDCWSGNSAKE